MIMRRLEVGDIVATSYGTGPYRIVEIERGCTCPDPMEEMEVDDPPDSPPHIHIVGICIDGHLKGKKGWLNGYDEKSGRNVWRPDDQLVLVDALCGPVQTTMF